MSQNTNNSRCFSLRKQKLTFKELFFVSMWTIPIIAIWSWIGLTGFWNNPIGFFLLPPVPLSIIIGMIVICHSIRKEYYIFNKPLGDSVNG